VTWPYALRPSSTIPVPTRRYRDGDRIGRGHGRWRELDEPPAGGDALARGITLDASQQRHALDILVQERPSTRLDSDWYVACDPFEASMRSGPPLHSGTYRLEICLRSPDLLGPARFTFGLVIPHDDGFEGLETLPQVTPA
jgi:hypothetical protein